MNFIPNCGRLLVKQDDAPDLSKSGLIKMPTGVPKPERGTVVAVGPPDEGLFNPNPSYTVGDTVFFQVYCGKEIELDDTKYLVFDEEDILGKLGPA